MKNEKEFYQNLAEKHAEELTYPYDELIKAIGFDAMYELVKCFGGSALYIPSLRKLFKKGMDEHILNEFDGYNHVKLARKYDLCERTIFNIIKEDEQKHIRETSNE